MFVPWVLHHNSLITSVLIHVIINYKNLVAEFLWNTAWWLFICWLNMGRQWWWPAQMIFTKTKLFERSPKVACCSKGYFICSNTLKIWVTWGKSRYSKCNCLKIIVLCFVNTTKSFEKVWFSFQIGLVLRIMH